MYQFFMNIFLFSTLNTEDDDINHLELYTLYEI